MHLFRISLCTCKCILVYRSVTTNRQDSFKLIVLTEGLDMKEESNRQLS